MSEVDPTSEDCPICKDKECKIHLLARFDESGDEGKFGVGAFRHCAKRLWLTIRCLELLGLQSLYPYAKWI
jgi:hypothetical protein